MEKKKKTAIMIGCALLIFILIAIIVVLVILLAGRKEPENQGDTNGYVINEDNYQQIVEEMDARVEAGYFETYMNTEWTFSDGESETKNAILGNSPNNTKPIRCEVLLDDTGETVFSTGVIPVGKLVPAFKLDVDLDAGTYDATCVIYLMDEGADGNYRDTSSAGFHVTIIVEN